MWMKAFFEGKGTSILIFHRTAKIPRQSWPEFESQGGTNRPGMTPKSAPPHLKQHSAAGDKASHV